MILAKNKTINPYPANVENMVAPTNASKWRMGFNSAFKGLNKIGFLPLTPVYVDFIPPLSSFFFHLNNAILSG
jgi:hypothetical protein